MPSGTTSRDACASEPRWDGSPLGISSQDDDYEQVSLPFAFPIAGRSFTSVYVSTNGLLTFGEGNDSYDYVEMDEFSYDFGEYPAIAPFWTDLNPGAGGTIYFKAFADRAIIQFEQVRLYGSSSSCTFQVVLHPNGVVNIFYKSMAGTRSATIGMYMPTPGAGSFVQDTYVTLSNDDDYYLDVRDSQGRLAVRFSPEYAVLRSLPERIRVNADFDEGRIDPATNRAIRDCDVADLRAQRDSFHDPAIKQDRVVLKDLSFGFLGFSPWALPRDWGDGATITLRKVAQTDPETGQSQTGDIRLWRYRSYWDNDEALEDWILIEDEQQIDFHPTGGNPVNLAPLLYGNSPSVSSARSSSYYIEGISPGPLTLEFTYTKGSRTFTRQQTILVATHQSKRQWQEDIRRQILLETSVAGSPVDMAAYRPPWPAAPFMTHKAHIQQVYSYYEYLYLQKPDLFLWCGLAKMAGGPVYGAMVDAEYGRGPSLPSWVPGGTIPTRVANFFQRTLMKGNYDIFNDLAWQFYAYEASGIWALRYVRTNGLDTPGRAIDILYWNQLWQGEYSASTMLVRTANFNLTNREQQFIVQDAWDDFKTHGVVGLEYLLGVLAQSPVKGVVSGADSFTYVVGLTADITTFSDRWIWINDASDGIWEDWTGLSTGARTGMVTIPLDVRAQSFSLFYIYSIGLFPIIW